MTRFLLLATCALMLFGSGCCWWHRNPYCGYGGGMSPYGAGYAPYGGGGAVCPGGNCGPGFPSGGIYGPGVSADPYFQTSAAPYSYQTSASLDYLPAY
jgi:hypothetical protein